MNLSGDLIGNDFFNYVQPIHGGDFPPSSEIHYITVSLQHERLHSRVEHRTFPSRTCLHTLPCVRHPVIGKLKSKYSTVPGGGGDVLRENRRLQTVTH